MKYATLFLTFILLSSEIFAQSSYVPFPEGEAVWHVGQKDPSWIIPDHEQYMYAGDTTINGFSYHKLSFKYEWVSLPSGDLVFTDYGTVGYIRQDSFLRKVYYVPKTEMQEYLLYDFSLQVGDTCPLTYGHNYLPPLIVIDKDSLMLGNVSRTRFTLLRPGGMEYDTVKIIEGIGSLSGPLTQFSDLCFEYCEWLACFQQDGETVFSSELFNFFPFGYCHIVGIDVPEAAINNFLLYPNVLSSGSIATISNKSHKAINVSVYDLLGSLIFNGLSDHAPDFSIETRGFQKGMYIVTIVANGEAPFNTRLIIQ